jgi:imidazolonepropionase-like amidohydrolase
VLLVRTFRWLEALRAATARGAAACGKTGRTTLRKF